MTAYKVAVIGVGHLGRIHARLLREHADALLVAVADPQESPRRTVAEELQVPGCAHHSELRGKIDAAIVATPTNCHFEVCRDLLLDGVHVLVEKPITLRVDEADELLACAKARQRTLAVGHVERFNPALAAARPHLDYPWYVEAVRASGYACRSYDVSVVLDLMIHDLDVVLSLVRSPVVEVHAIGATLVGPHADLAQARLTFANGCVANLTSSRVSYQPQRQLQVFCPSAYAAIDFGQRSARLVRPSTALARGVHVEAMSGAERELLKTRLFQDFLPLTELAVPERNALLDEQRDFLDCVRTGRSPLVSGHDGRAALAVADRIHDEIREFLDRVAQREEYRRAFAAAGDSGVLPLPRPTPQRRAG